MPSPLSDAQREQILAAARVGDQSRNAIARDVGVSAASVSKVCRQAGPPSANTRTVEAVQVRTLDARERRTRLEEQTLDDIDDARRALRTVGNPRELVDAAKAVSLLVNAHVRVAAVDHDTDRTDEQTSVLGGIAAALGFNPTGDRQ